MLRTEDMFYGNRRPNTAVQVLCNVVWACSLGGLALVAEERRRQLAFVQRVIESGKKLQAHKTYHTAAPLAVFDLGGTLEAGSSNPEPYPLDIQHHDPASSQSKTLTNYEWRNKKRIVRPLPKRAPPTSRYLASSSHSTAFENPDDQTPSVNAPQPPSETERSSLASSSNDRTRYEHILQDVIAERASRALNSDNLDLRQQGLQELKSFFSSAPEFASGKMQDTIATLWTLPSCERESILSLDLRKNILAAIDASRPQSNIQVSKGYTRGTASSKANLRTRFSAPLIEHCPITIKASHPNKVDYREAFYQFLSLCEGPGIRTTTDQTRDWIQNLIELLKSLSLYSVVEVVHFKTVSVLKEWRLLHKDIDSLTQQDFWARTPELLQVVAINMPYLNGLTQSALSKLTQTTLPWLMENGHQETAQHFYAQALHCERCLGVEQMQYTLALGIVHRLVERGELDDATFVFSWTLDLTSDDKSRIRFTEKCLEVCTLNASTISQKFLLDVLRTDPEITRALNHELIAGSLRPLLRGTEESSQRIPILREALLEIFETDIPMTIIRAMVDTGHITHAERLLRARLAETQLSDLKIRVKSTMHYLQGWYREASGPKSTDLTLNPRSVKLVTALLRCTADIASSHGLENQVAQIFFWTIDEGIADSHCFDLLLKQDGTEAEPARLREILVKLQTCKRIPLGCVRSLKILVKNATGLFREFLESEDFYALLHDDFQRGLLRESVSGPSDRSRHVPYSIASSAAESFQAFCKNGPVSQAKDFLDKLPANILSEASKEVASSGVLLLSRIWEATHNSTLAGDVFARITALNAEINPAQARLLYTEMIKICVQDGDAETAQCYTHQLREQFGLGPNIEIRLALMYAHALAGCWDTVVSQLNQMQQFERGKPVKVALNNEVHLLDGIFGAYCQNHSAEEVVEFFNNWISKYNFPASSKVCLDVLNTIVHEEDYGALDQWLSALRQNQLQLPISYSSVSKLLRRVVEPEPLTDPSRIQQVWQRIGDPLISTESSMRGIVPRRIRVGQHEFREPLPITRKLVTLPSRVNGAVRAMSLAVQRHKHRKVIHLYRESQAKGLLNQTVSLDMAVSASLWENRPSTKEAMALINEAEEASISTARAHRTVKNFRALQLADSESELHKVVFNRYEELLSLPHEGQNHHTTRQVLVKLLKQRRAGVALRLLAAVHESQWIQKTPFNLAMWSIVVSIGGQARNARVIRWAVDQVLKSDLRIEKLFVDRMRWTLLRIRAKLRHSVSAEDVRHCNELLKTIDGCIRDCKRRRKEQRQQSLSFFEYLARTADEHTAFLASLSDSESASA